MAILRCVEGCTRRHEYQDQKYGRGMRVMNLCKPKTDNEVRHRCTVCLAEHVRVKANKGKEKK